MSICMDNAAVEQPDGTFKVFPIGSWMWIGLKVDNLLKDAELIGKLRSFNEAELSEEERSEFPTWNLSFEEADKVAKARSIAEDARAADVTVTLPLSRDELMTWDDYLKIRK